MKFDDKYYEYLDELRDSGTTNMFGAAVYLQKEFKIDKEAAREILKDWMETFSERQNEKERI